jgi:hypothetical protein
VHQPLTQQAQERAHRARRRGERVALSIPPPRTMCILSLSAVPGGAWRARLCNRPRAAQPDFTGPRGASRSCRMAARQRALRAQRRGSRSPCLRSSIQRWHFSASKLGSTVSEMHQRQTASRATCIDQPATKSRDRARPLRAQ